MQAATELKEQIKLNMYKSLLQNLMEKKVIEYKSYYHTSKIVPFNVTIRQFIYDMYIAIKQYDDFIRVGKFPAITETGPTFIVSNMLYFGQVFSQILDVIQNAILDNNSKLQSSIKYILVPLISLQFILYVALAVQYTKIVLLLNRFIRLLDKVNTSTVSAEIHTLRMIHAIIDNANEFTHYLANYTFDINLLDNNNQQAHAQSNAQRQARSAAKQKQVRRLNYIRSIVDYRMISLLLLNLSLYLLFQFINYQKMQGFIQENRDFVFEQRKYCDSSYAFGYALCIKEVIYNYYETLPYVKTIAPKQEYYDRYLSLLDTMKNFTNQVLYRQSSSFSRQFYDFLDRTLNENICGEGILNLKDFQRWQCEVILHGSLKKGLLLAIQEQHQLNLQEYQASNFIASRRSPIYPEVDLAFGQYWTQQVIRLIVHKLKEDQENKLDAIIQFNILSLYIIVSLLAVANILFLPLLFIKLSKEYEHFKYFINLLPQISYIINAELFCSIKKTYYNYLKLKDIQ